MSLLTTASLVITPNAGEEGTLFSIVPDTGLGDMSVTRATTATRVNSAGLVELVPYNLLSYSEQFDNAAWTKSSVSVTANSTTAPNGTMTADTIVNTATSGILLQVSPSLSPSQLVTFSVYLKRSNNDWANVAIARNGATTYGELYVWFNIATGAVGSNLPDGAAVFVDADIESVGDGWYRCSVTGYVPNAVAYTAFVFNASADNSFTTSIGQSRYQWGAQLVEGAIKDYQKTETRLNIPRLDYSNGTCPSLLVEPQRTNLLTYSSSFDNSAWIKTGATVTANNTTAPDGTMSADRVVFSGFAEIEQEVIYASGNGTHTVTCYVKTNSGTQDFKLKLTHAGVANYYSPTYTATTEWQRFTFTQTFGSGGVGFYAGVNCIGGTLNVWGAQLEANSSYATSYIPTTSASVTRNADVISKTGISSLIGQTEGTLFWEGQGNTQSTGDDLWILDASANDTSTAVLLYYVHSSGYINCYINNGSSYVNLGAPITITDNNKVAVGYKSGDFVMYVNGTQVDSNTSATAIPSGMNQVAFNKWLGVTGLQKQSTKAAALWKTRLTNVQLAQLTTI
jgi:hypothetical protein